MFLSMQKRNIKLLVGLLQQHTNQKEECEGNTLNVTNKAYSRISLVEGRMLHRPKSQTICIFLIVN